MAHDWGEICKNIRTVVKKMTSVKNDRAEIDKNS